MHDEGAMKCAIPCMRTWLEQRRKETEPRASISRRACRLLWEHLLACAGKRAMSVVDSGCLSAPALALTADTASAACKVAHIATHRLASVAFEQPSAKGMRSTCRRWSAS